jgi:predicted transcriptional regulator
MVTKLTENIIEKLKTRQKELGLSDDGFAKHIGISRPLWALVKVGTRQPGMKFTKAVIRAFPDLEFDMWNYIRSRNSEKVAK